MYVYCITISDYMYFKQISYTKEGKKKGILWSVGN